MIRITADGGFKVCLFDNREINLKDMLTNGLSDEEIL
jgi:molybdenum cofactor biosynthesis enzyme MoaA